MIPNGKDLIFDPSSVYRRGLYRRSRVGVSGPEGQVGDFLKVRRTDVQDRGTVKSISLDGKVQIMTESGVSIFQRDQIYLLTCIAGHGRCTSIGPHGDKSWFSFH